MIETLPETRITNDQCAFFARVGRCKALNDNPIAEHEVSCKNCSFFKTPEELAQGRRASNYRLINLPKEQFNGILGMYYGGCTPE